MTATRAGRRSWSRMWFCIHGLLGTALGLMLLVICSSGACAALSYEVDWLLNPDIRTEPPPGKTRRATWGEMYAAVTQAFPNSKVSWMSAPLGPRYTAEVVIETPAKQLRRVYVDPYTAKVRGSTSYFHVQRFFRSFHYGLSVPESYGWGLLLVSGFGLVLLCVAVTGMLFYPRWWRALFRVRIGRGRRALFADLHRCIGAWALGFSLLIGLTGVWYFIEEIQWKTDTTWDEPTPKLPPAEVAGRPPERLPLALDVQVAIARSAFPGLDVRTVAPPSAPDEATYIDGQATAWLVRDRANRVYIDPWDGDVIKVQRAEDLALHYRWVDTADPLHFGSFAGLPSKILWSALGLGVCMLIFTGGYLAVARSQGALAQRRHGSVAAEGGRTDSWWQLALVLVGAVLSLAALAAGLRFSWLEMVSYGPLGPDGERMAPEVAWPVAAFIGGYVLALLAGIGVATYLLWRLVRAKRGGQSHWQGQMERRESEPHAWLF